MNITSYIQQREHGKLKHQRNSQRKAELFLESRLTNTFVNKSCEISGRCRSTFVMEFSPDGTKVASTHGDHSVRVTEISTGKCLHTLHGHPRTPWCLAYHPSYSNILASGCLGGQVRIWDLYGHGCEVWQCCNDLVIASLAFHPTDKVLVIAAGNTIYFWDWDKPEPFATCSTAHEFERLRWIRFDSHGHTLYTGISNSIDIHADEVSSRPTRVVTRSPERHFEEGQSSRLGRVYNNIVNCYQDYRRSRLLGQMRQEGAQGAGSMGARTGPGHAESTGPYGTTFSRNVARDRSRAQARQTASEVLDEISETLSAMRRNELLDSYADEPPVGPPMTGLDTLHRNYGINSQRGRWRSFDRVLNSPTPRQSVFSTLPENERDLLLHPPADPFLSSATEQPANPLLSSVTESLSNENTQSAGLDSSTVLLEPPPVANSATSLDSIQSHDIADDLSHDLSHASEPDSVGEIEIPLESVTGQRVRLPGSVSRQYVRPSVHTRQYLRPQFLCSRVQTSTESESSDVSLSHQPSVDMRSNCASANQATERLRHVTNNSAPPHTSATVSDSENNVSQSRISCSSFGILGTYRNTQHYTVTGQNSDRTNSVSDRQETEKKEATEAKTASTVADDSSSNSVTSGVLASSAVSSVSESQLPLLTRFLKTSHTKSDKTGRNSTKKFPSIRERLQSSVPLCSMSASSTLQPCTSGIPKVTVIMGRDLDTSGHPQDSGARSFPQSSSSHEETGNKDSSFKSDIENMMVKRLKTCDERQDSTSSGSINDSSQTDIASNSSLSETLTFGAFDGSTNSSASCEVSQRLPMNPPAEISSTDGHCTLLQKLSQNNFSSSQKEAPLVDAQDQTQSCQQRPCPNRNKGQKRGRFLPLMGPYLQSRGLSPFASAPENVPSEGNSITGVHPAWTPLNPDSNDDNTEQTDRLTSQETEQGLSAHFSQSDSSTNMVSGIGNLPVSFTHSDASEHLVPCVQSVVNSDTLLPESLVGQEDSSENVTEQRPGDLQGFISVQGQSAASQSSTLSQGNEVELVVDQNENYTTNRNLASEQERDGEIIHRNHDSNNNSIHITLNANPPINSVGQGVDQRNQDYVRLRDSFVSMTDQIEREMNDLNRRINALRESFNESIRSLRQDRHRYETLADHLPAETATNLGSGYSRDDVETLNGNPVTASMANYTRMQGWDSVQGVSAEMGTGLPVSQPPTLLETSLRSHAQVRRPLHPRLAHQAGEEEDTHHWRQLHRHHLHPHYSASILDETINRPSNAFQSAINRAIAGAFMGAGESSVASNIMSQTHRIQFWDFTKCNIPDISQSKVNIVVPHCKLHNSASADISGDNSLLATFVPSHQGFPDSNILAVYSLLPSTRGQCLYTKQFGPNAVSVSISPSNNHILVCLAARRLTWVFSSQQLVGQIFKLEKKHAGENSMKHIKDVDHTCNSEIRTHVSGNSARWLPLPGQGLVYGTNRGDLNICRHGVKIVTSKIGSAELESLGADDPASRLSSLLSRSPWGLYSSWNRVNSATQTGSVRLNAGTQTPGLEDN